MSSDSDEDELLQMALKEQAQRDLNYGKSSSNSRKPVANYVQPPSSQSKKPAPPSTSKKSQNKGRVVDDDDDSEVEMLSISSGDEDIAKDPVTSSRNRGSGRAPAREDDRTWDGEEPSRWKHVDEAEVCYRYYWLGFMIIYATLYALSLSLISLISLFFLFNCLFVNNKLVYSCRRIDSLIDVNR